MNYNMANVDLSKKSAALKAVEYIEDNAIIGLGTGSTMAYALEAIARRIKEEELKIKGIPTSIETEKIAKKLGIPITTLDQNPSINLAIDGADEVDKKLNLIKGKKGALTREKIVASAALEFIVIVDESKRVNKIGNTPVPIEVLPFAVKFVDNELREIGGMPKLREKFVTDNGNFIIDVKIDIKDPLDMECTLNNIPGIIENGIFAVRIPDRVIIGKGKDTEILE